MSKRKIIEIDDQKCNGCGECIPNCPEGALQIINGKARLVSELFCDGLGACIKECPKGAISIQEREAEEYNEEKVMENIVQKGKEVIKAHLDHLKEHGEEEFYKEAISYLKENNIEIPEIEEEEKQFSCPSVEMGNLTNKEENSKLNNSTEISSHLNQWPVQLYLIPPNAPYFKGEEVIISADCVAYTLGNFHTEYLKGRSLAIACPKLDDSIEKYKEKIKAFIEEAEVKSLTVMIMEVPCCKGLLSIVKDANKEVTRDIPVYSIIVGINGEIKIREKVNSFEKRSKNED